MSITPEELGQATKRESLPLHWLGDSDVQKMDRRFPMVRKGKGSKGKGETSNRLVLGHVGGYKDCEFSFIK